MTDLLPKASILIRPAQYRDLETAERLLCAAAESPTEAGLSSAIQAEPGWPQSRWQGFLWACRLLLHPHQYMFCAQPCVQAQDKDSLYGLVRVSPFNRTRTTWRVDRVVLDHAAINGAISPTPPPSSSSVALAVTLDPPHSAPAEADAPGPSVTAAVTTRPFTADVGSLLLRYCFEKIWEARTWLLEVNVNDKEALALYRQNGFQPLAQMTYWAIAPRQLQDIAERDPDLPNLLPVSNADAQLLYQLDTIAMPPLVRQVFDRHLPDFKTSLFRSLIDAVKNWFSKTEVVSAYVFESQRKAAIGYFQVRLCLDGAQPHQAQLTVHPAYTWLYPELLCQMARLTQEVPSQSLQLTSADYHSEREECLERVGAVRMAHTLMMSRSVWHKLRETKPATLEGLQLADVLQGLKPARKPIPSRITPHPSVLKVVAQDPSVDPSAAGFTPPPGDSTGRPGKPAKDRKFNVTPPKSRLTLPNPSDFSEPPQEGPCC
jgi:hypothetical protein